MDLNFGFHKKTRLVLQSEAAECGIAALAMVADYHGLQTDLPTLRGKYAVSLKGASIADLMRVANSMGFQSRAVRVELDDIDKLSVPCILHWELKHFVVLTKVTRNAITLLDPARGLRKLSRNEVAQLFTGVALEVLPGPSFRRKTERQRIDIFGLLRNIHGLKRSLTQVFILALALEIFGLSLPFFSQWAIDDVLVSKDSDLLIVLSVGLLFVSIFQVAASWLRSIVLLHLTTTVSLGWINGVFSHLMQLPMSWSEKRHLGDVMSRFSSVGSIQQMLTSGLASGLIDGLMSIVILAVMLAYSRQLAFIAAGAVVIYAVIRLLRFDILRRANGEQIIRSAKQQSHFMESIRGIQVIKSFNRQAERSRRFMHLATESTNAGLLVQRQAMSFAALNGLLTSIENALILYLGAQLVILNQISAGMFIAFLSYKTQFIGRTSSFVDQWISFRMIGLQTEQVADIVLAAPEQKIASIDPVRKSLLLPTVELKNLSFRYAPGEPWVLKDFSLKIEAGESVAIIGPSGAGKTTLMKLIIGQLEPIEGSISIDGQNLRQVGLNAWRDSVGVVMQDDRLCAGSILDNISCFAIAAEITEVETAAKLAAIHDEIVKMPMGYHTLVGDMGSALSGGQRQRVVLARALFKKPNLLVLDEATSNLDVRTESLISGAVQQLSMTRVVIAHRPQTIEAMDRVVSIAAPEP